MTWNCKSDGQYFNCTQPFGNNGVKSNREPHPSGFDKRRAVKISADI